ncbi:MAG TPA: glycosyltransferase family 4 protein [Actinomycetota bacterium]|nr:glycosyltransferase family 4 protein [Actinomycetota bacterium]
MRIVQIVNLGYVGGGAENVVHLVREAMIARGHHVLVIATDRGLEGRESFADVALPQIVGSAPRRLLRYAWDAGTKRAVEEVLVAFDPDVVHLHTVSEFSPSVLWALGGVPSLLTVHGPEEFTLGLLAAGLPASDYRNESYLPSDLRMIGRIRYLYQRFMQRPLWLLGARRNLAMMLAPSRYTAAILERDAGRVPIRHLPNGIYLPAPQPLPGCPSVLYAGRLESYKGVGILLQAMKRLVTTMPTSRLVVAGDGSKRAALEGLAHRLGLAHHVAFAGWVSPHHLPRYYAASQVVAVPSLCPETLPTVVIEALAVGRPVVGSNVGGIPELVTDGVTGKIVEPGDVDGLADALLGILSDAHLARRMSLAARQAAAAFDAEGFLDALERIYEELAVSRRAPVQGRPDLEHGRRERAFGVPGGEVSLGEEPGTVRRTGLP